VHGDRERTQHLAARRPGRGRAHQHTAVGIWSLAIQQAAAQFFGGYGGRAARPAAPDPPR
jgi:hypothetical protein